MLSFLITKVIIIIAAIILLFFLTSDTSDTPRNRIGKCSTSSESYAITVRCEALSDPNAIGFQVIAQHTKEARNLYVAESLDLQTPAVVQVESEGIYQITVLSLRQSSGILNSHTEYTSQEKIPPEIGKIIPWLL